MISKESLSKNLYFDVETARCESSLESLREKNPRLAELWSRRSDYYKNLEECSGMSESDIFLTKAGLEPEFAKIVCVSFGTFDDSGEKRFVSFYGEDEIEILNKSNKILNNALLKGWKLCGHNIKAFDVPCLGKRMIYSKIQPSQNINVCDKKPWEIPFLDTSELFSFGSWTMQKSLSLDLLACSLGIDSPKGDIKGSEVSDVFWKGGDYERIKEYCERDVKAVMEILEAVSF
jgi:hypothetical protein